MSFKVIKIISLYPTLGAPSLNYIPSRSVLGLGFIGPVFVKMEEIDFIMNINIYKERKNTINTFKLQCKLLNKT
jgi:hypothetical protein